MKMQRRQPKDQVFRQYAVGRNREQESKAGQSRRRNKPTNGRVMKTLRRFNQNRRVADLRPSSINVRKKIESAFVLKYQDITVVKNFFFDMWPDVSTPMVDGGLRPLRRLRVQESAHDRERTASEMPQRSVQSSQQRKTTFRRSPPEHAFCFSSSVRVAVMEWQPARAYPLAPS